MKTMFARNQRQSILGAIGTAALKSPLPNHSLLITPKREPIENILEGSFYEIDHSKLPARTPVMLRAVRAVMVTAKSELNVTVRYPSAQSLEAYFGNVDHISHRSELYPALDEKFIMGPKLVVDVLRRQIPSQEFENLRHLKSFWLMGFSRAEQLVTTQVSEVKHGPCFSKLQESQIKGWGSKRLVAYLPDSGEFNDLGEVKSSTLGEQKDFVKQEECHETKKDEEVIIQYSRKRKRGKPLSSHIKKSKYVPKQKAIEVKAEFEGNNKKDYVDRWPTKRYEQAAMKLAEVVKKNGGYHDNPISRFQLRIEARKRIGDTGLLDHLLKHLVGKVVPPDGKERIRRRCDAEGMMEYWLESADLADIRVKAGVTDPYWIPPPGWKLGDTIGAPNCKCRDEIRILKKELNSMRSQMAELKTKDENEQPITMVVPDNAPIPSWRFRTGNMDRKEIYEALMTKKFVLEEQLLQISKALVELEEDMNSHSNKAGAGLQLMSYHSLTAEEMNNEDMKKAAEAAVRDASQGHGEGDESISQAQRLVVKLRPCRLLDNMNNASLSQVNHSVQDFMGLASASGSPLSTTTS